MRAVLYSSVVPAIENLVAAARSLGVEPVAVLTPRKIRDAQAARVLDGDRGTPQAEDGMTYAPAFGEDYAELDPSRTRGELERQVSAWALMFDKTVVGPVATLDSKRYLVHEATHDDPDDPEALRLEACDGPLWLTSVEPL